MTDYDELKKVYPKFITKEQLYKIAKISKNHAKQLLDYGIIPCEDTGKKTHKYIIALKDVIRYLELRDEGNVPPPQPERVIKNKRKKHPKCCSYSTEKMSFPKEFMQYRFENAGDVMPIKEFCEFANMAIETVREKISREIINALFLNNKYFILKKSAIKYTVTTDYAKYLSFAGKYDELFKDFCAWKSCNLT